jgi:hypothetical protein
MDFRPLQLMPFQWAANAYDNDISGAFPQRIFHPDTALANASIYRQWLIIAIAMHFGGNFCPPSWEPLSWARYEIAKYLYEQNISTTMPCTMSPSTALN